MNYLSEVVLFFVLVRNAVIQVCIFLFFFTVFGWFGILARDSVLEIGELNERAGILWAVAWLAAVTSLYILYWFAMRPAAPTLLKKYLLITKRTDKNAGLIERFPTAVMLGMIVGSAVIALYTVAAASALMQSQQVFKYSQDNVEINATNGQFFNFYLWHLVDMFPFFDFWEVYQIKPPISPNNFSAQTALLVFKSTVIGLATAIVTQLLQYYRSKNKKEADG